MRQINLTPNFIMSHLKYCREKFDITKHGNMQYVEYKETKYLAKRPFGRLIRYRNRGYPLKFSSPKKLNLNKRARIKLVDLLLKFFNKIITSKPVELLKVESTIYNELSEFTSLSADEIKNETKLFLEYIFNYKSFSEEEFSEDSWGAYKFLKELNISICPYCNAQFTFTIYKTEKGIDEEVVFKIRPALDHVLPKSIHPLLAISVYNLIPTCDTCNSNLKGSDIIDLDTFIHPYMQDINEIGSFRRKLNLEEKDYYSQIVGKNLNYNIEFISKKAINNEKVKKYESLFGINNRYELHKDYLNKQIVLRLIYNEVYLKRLEISYGKELFSNILIKDILYETDINNSILSKAVHDLLKEIFVNEKHFNKEQLMELEKILEE